MMLDSYGFVGDRLRQARLALKLTQTQLAELIEKKPNTISAYEADRIKPTDEVLNRLGIILGQPIEFFYKPLPKLKENAVFYRSMTASTKTSRDKAEARLLMLREIYVFLHDYIEFPTVIFPLPPNIPEEPEEITLEIIESAAKWMRNYWGLSDKPIPNLTRLLESKGAVIAFDNLDEESLDALSEWGHPESAPFFLLNREIDSSVRTRMNLAHELGHMCLHRHLDRKKIERGGKLFKLIEAQAFAFASAFLMPKSSITDDLSIVNIDRLKILKRKWLVSMSAITRRAKDIEMISDDYYSRLNKSISRNGWRKREPYDDEFSIERPNTLKVALETLVREDVFSADEFQKEMALGERYLKSLCGLDDDFFRPSIPELRVIKFG